MNKCRIVRTFNSFYPFRVQCEIYGVWIDKIDASTIEVANEYISKQKAQVK